MKMRARGKLNGRNPSSPASSSSDAKYTNHPPYAAAIPASTAQAMAHTPDARPFSPSMKLTALVANSTHASVSGTPAQPSVTGPRPGRFSRSTTSPLPTATAAAATCAPSLMANGQSRMSSRKATRAMAAAARITPRKYGSARRANSA